MDRIAISCFLTLFILVFSQPGLSQKKYIENVKGEWVVSNDITIVQARENALNQAKVEALRLAGVPEYVSESNIMFRSEKKEQMKELFESLTTVDVSGEISEYNIVKEEKKLNQFGNLSYEVSINATVIIHKSVKDPGFNFDVKGVREQYLSPDKLTMEIKPWKEGYLSIFILNEKESGQLFPNTLERQEKLIPEKNYFFPKSKSLDYEVTTEGAIEINYLLLLYTMQEVPFTLEQTAQNILRFIGNIDPSQRCLKSYSFLIKKQ